MSQTIEERSSGSLPPHEEFEGTFVTVLVLVTLGTILLFAFLRPPGPEMFEVDSLRVTVGPFLIAAGHTISDGLSRFSTGISSPISESHRWTILLSIFFFYVALPVVFLHLWRSNLKRPQDLRKKLSVGMIPFIVSGVLCGFLVIFSVFAAIAQRSVFTSMRSRQSIQENKDLMINDLNSIAWRLHQYRIIPREAGGGGRSFVGFTAPEGLLRTEDGVYELDVTDWVVKIRAASRKYEEAHIRTQMGPDGQLVMWEYDGDFR